MTRQEQYTEFTRMELRLKAYLFYKKVPFRNGEAHRPLFVAQKYVTDGVGILNSKHRYSLAMDIWLTHSDGKGIYWCGSYMGQKPGIDALYRRVGIYWEKLGGTWGGRFKRYDPYHYELKEKPA